MKRSIIYETRGRAREYCELAVNLYSGCTHGCIYCYVPEVLHKDKAQFVTEVKPRVTIDELRLSADFHRDEKRPILMCFTCDPYQPIEARLKLTRAAISELHDYGLRFTVLTKAGELAQRDFGLYKEGDSFATTLTFLDQGASSKYEPAAGEPTQRINNLRVAHRLGIPTWVSLEPVIDPYESVAIIAATHEYVDHYKIGVLNYRKNPKPINWRAFAQQALIALGKYKKSYHIKSDLGKFIGNPDGLREGVQLP